MKIFDGMKQINTLIYVGLAKTAFCLFEYTAMMQVSVNMFDYIFVFSWIFWLI